MSGAIIPPSRAAAALRCGGAFRLARVPVAPSLRFASSASKAKPPPKKESLWERNDRLREASEAKLEESRRKL